MRARWRASRRTDCHHCVRGNASHPYVAVQSFRYLLRLSASPAESTGRMTADDTVRDLAARCARGLPNLLARMRAQGMPGARCTRGLVCNVRKEVRTRAYRYSGTLRHSLRNGLRLMPRSPRRRIRLASVIGELAVFEPGRARRHLRRFDTSHGCQDHTVLPYAASFTIDWPCATGRSSGGGSAVRLRAVDRSRKTALRTCFAPDAAASTASHPNVS